MIDHTAADYCPCCGQPRERSKEIERFGLTLRGSFLIYHGRRARLAPGVANFARAIMERGAATHEFITLRVCPEAESNIRQVYANRFRAQLKALTGGAIALLTHHSWGYELIEAEPHRAAA